MNKRHFHLKGIQIPVLQFTLHSCRKVCGLLCEVFEDRKSNLSDNHLKALGDPLGWVVTGVVAWCRDALPLRWSVSTLQAVARICIVSLIHRNLGQSYTMRSPLPHGCFKLKYIPFPEYSQSKCSLHFLVNVCTRNVHQSPCFFYFTRWHLFSSITKWQILKKQSNLAVSKFGLWVFKT